MPQDPTANTSFSVGVEEEFLLVHPTTGQPLPLAEKAVDTAADLGIQLHRELTTSQVETTTPVCQNLRQLRSELFGLRSVAAAAALSAGARLTATGAPLAGETTLSVTDLPRYRHMAQRYGRLVEEHSICGCHVHIGLSDRETAVQVSNHLRRWLPALLAMTANSSVYCGRDTGHASWRSVLASRWPCSGPPPHFASATRYDATVAMLIDTGAVLDPGMIYWDVRPSAHLPTIEIRVSDVPATIDETVLLAALIRGLVATAVHDLGTGTTATPIPPEALRAAYWRSARDGLTGRALDPVTMRRTTPADLLATLVRHIRPQLEEFGDLTLVRARLTAIFAEGNGAIRQRRALGYRNRLTDVVDQAVRDTTRDTHRAAQPDLPSRHTA
jgi:carboxylate-amine ligase